MNKLLLCAALLAMSYIVSADVTVYNLPLSLKAYPTSTEAYKSHNTETNDGKAYYVDQAADKSQILQVWDSKNQSQGTATNVTDLLETLESEILFLQSIGDAVYVVVGNDGLTSDSIDLYQTQNSSVNFTLPSTIGDSGNATLFRSRACQTTDGKFYYFDGDFKKNPTLQVWDSVSKTQGTGIALANLATQVQAFLNGLSNADSSFYLGCIGTTVYLNVAYSDDNNKVGIQVFKVQADASAPTYALPLALTRYSKDLYSFLSGSCATTDGKLHYLDGDDATKSYYLQEWDSSDQNASDQVSLTDAFSQLSTFMATLGPNGGQDILLQCLGNNVYINVAWSNETTSGINQYFVKKSAGILSFSYAAIFLALVALLL